MAQPKPSGQVVEIVFHSMAKLQILWCTVPRDGLLNDQCRILGGRDWLEAEFVRAGPEDFEPTLTHRGIRDGMRLGASAVTANAPMIDDHAF